MLDSKGRSLIISRFILILLALLTSTVLAQPCVVCSVNEGILHDEGCELTEQFEGEQFFFCQSGCRETFLADPTQFKEAYLALKQEEQQEPEKESESESQGSLVPS